MSEVVENQVAALNARVGEVATQIVALPPRARDLLLSKLAQSANPLDRAIAAEARARLAAIPTRPLPL